MIGGIVGGTLVITGFALIVGGAIRIGERVPLIHDIRHRLLLLLYSGLAVLRGMYYDFTGARFEPNASDGIWRHPRGMPGRSAALSLLSEKVDRSFQPCELGRVGTVSNDLAVGALKVPVISTVELFGWWRTADWAAIRTAVFGAEPPPAGAITDSAASSALGAAAVPTAPPSRPP